VCSKKRERYILNNVRSDKRVGKKRARNHVARTGTGLLDDEDSAGKDMGGESKI